MIAKANAKAASSKRHAKVEFLGFNFDEFGAAEALDEVIHRVGNPNFFYVVTPNVDHVVGLNRSQDTTFLNAFEHADMTLCDSRILSLLAGKSALSLKAVPGSDLTRQLLATMGTVWRCAIIGGDDALYAHIVRMFPQHHWTQHQPPMGVRRSDAARSKIADFVEHADADIIFFAIGSPQSEICCYEIAQRGRARGVALCIGASLEFITGVKKRAPLWIQRASLEWLHRLMSEPRRLGRRYLVEGPNIFLIYRRWSKVRAARRHDGSGSNPSAGQ